MFGVRVTFTVLAEMALPEGAYPVRRHDGSLAFVTPVSGRCERRTFIIPEGQRPTDVERRWCRNNVVFNDDTERECGQVVIRSTPPFLEEIKDNVGYTTLSVVFGVNGTCPTTKDDINRESLLDSSIGDVRTFCLMYRYYSRHVDVFMPSRQDVACMTVEVSEDFHLDDEGAAGHFRNLSHELRTPTAKQLGLGKALLRDDPYHEMVRRLRAGEALGVHDELILEAHELSLIHSDHRLALVTAETAFETALQRRVIDEHTVRRSSIAPGHPNDVAASELSIGNLLKQVSALAGTNITRCAEHGRWRKYAADPRNDIVHRGRSDIRETDFSEAIAAIQAFDELICTRLLQSRPQP